MYMYVKKTQKPTTGTSLSVYLNCECKGNVSVTTRDPPCKDDYA